MSIVTVTKQDNSLETFEDTVGHQIGNGAVQLMFKDGTQRIFNNFVEVFVDLDEEEKANWLAHVAKAEAKALAVIEKQEKEAEVPRLPKPAASNH